MYRLRIIIALLVSQISLAQQQPDAKYFQFTAPTKTTAWQMGTNQTIRWDIVGPADAPEKISLSYRFESTDSAFSKFQPIVSDVANSGSFVWQLPNVTTFFEGNYNLRICFDSLCTGARNTKYPEGSLSSKFYIYHERKNTTIYENIDSSATSPVSSALLSSAMISLAGIMFSAVTMI